MHKNPTSGTAIAYLLFAAASTPGLLDASTLAKSAGTLDVTLGFAAALNQTATASLCVTSTLNPMFVGNQGAGIDCATVVKNGALMGMYDGKGYKDEAKFPPSGNHQGTMTGMGGKDPDTTASSAVASWLSEEDHHGQITDREATFQLSANVARSTAKSPADVATAEGKDPWFFFTGDTAVSLILTVTLSAVDISAMADQGESSIATLEALSAFGLGSQVGEKIIAQGAFSQDVSANGTFHLDSDTLINLAILLEPNSTYWFTTDLAAGAEGAGVPEPSTSTTLGGATVGLLWYRWLIRRRKQA